MSDPYAELQKKWGLTSPTKPVQSSTDPYANLAKQWQDEQTPQPPAAPPGLLQRTQTAVANLVPKQVGDVARGPGTAIADWFHKTPLGAPKDMRVIDTNTATLLVPYERLGFFTNVAGLEIDNEGYLVDPRQGNKRITDTRLQQLMTALIPAGPAPALAARGVQRVLQRTGIVPREGGLIRETQPVRQAIEQGVGQLTGVPVKPPVSVAQSAAETARAAKQGLSVLPQTRPGEAPPATPGLRPGETPLPNVPTIGPPGSKLLSIRPENVPQDLADGLYRLRTQQEADRLRMRQYAQQVTKEAPEVHNEAVYHFDENPHLQIAPREQGAYNKYIQPLADEAERIRLKLGKRGVNPEEYTPRFPMGRGNVVDQLVEGTKALVGRSGILSKSAPQWQHRRFKALIDEEGNRMLAYIKDGEISTIKSGTHTSLGRFITKTEEQFMESAIRPLERRIATLTSKLSDFSTINWRQPGIIDRMIKELEGISESVVNTARDNTSNIALRLANQQRKLSHDLQMLSGPRTAIDKKIVKLQEAIADLTKAKDDILEQYNPLSASNKMFVTKTGKRYHIGEARTTEIEANTPVRYHKDVLVNRLVANQRLRSAERASDFLEAFKQDPSFKTIAHPMGAAGQPERFKPTALDQFRNYVFEPKVAAELDKYARVLKQGGGGPNILETINDYLRAAIFFNPMIHVPNIGVHWFVERGLLNFLNPVGYKRWFLTTGPRAANAIFHQTEDYLYALDHGAAMKYAGVINQDLHKWLIQKTAVDLVQTPIGRGVAALLRQFYGIANPVKWLYGLSNRATWFVNDWAILQRTYERMETHKEAFTTAFHEIERGIPNYRIPGTIFRFRALADIMSSPWTMFGNYHYGMMRAWGEMARDLVSRNPRITVDALDRLAAAIVAGVVIAPKADALFQRLSGDPSATVRRAGALTLPDLIYHFSEKELGLIDELERVITPGVLPRAVLRAAGDPYHSGDLHFGDLDIMVHEPGEAVAAGEKILKNTVAPVGFIDDVLTGGKKRARALWQLTAVRAWTTTPADRRLLELTSGPAYRDRLARVKQLYAAGNVARGNRIIQSHNNELAQIYRRSLQQHHIVMDARQVEQKLRERRMKPPSGQSVEQYRTRQDTPVPLRHPSRAPKRKRPTTP